MTHILELDNISFSYRNDTVLDSVTFSVNQGDYIALVGANGSGKSTLLKLILGFLEPKSGTLKYDKINHPISYIPQGGLESIDFVVTVEELLHFRKKRVTKKEVSDALTRVGMQDYAKELVKNLSGGQRQRVLIARELLSNPSLILLDEPTTGLDTKSIDMLYGLLKELNQEHHISIVLVTHHIDESCIGINRIVEVKDHTLKEKSHV